MEEKICQSCGMPLIEDIDFGTNKDGNRNTEYCSYCYIDGHFTKDCTMGDMIEQCLIHIDEYNKDMDEPVSVEEARSQMKMFFPHLKRWKNN